MSVPLDRLYHYLHDIVNEDIVIYRFFPHGSKKIEDLKALDKNGNYDKWARLAPAIFHDQEPLTYCSYSIEDICKNEQFQLAKILCDIVCHPKISEYFTLDFNVLFWGTFYTKTLLIHSELHSDEVKKFEANNFVGVYCWSHALIAKDWYRYAQHDLRLPRSNFKKTFLIYNRAWRGTREYRLKFAELVVDYNLIDDCLMKFNPYDNDCYYKDYQYKNKNFQVNKTLENYFDLNTFTSDMSADYNNNDYQETQIEIVLETLFDDSRWHLTEKILRPIACGHAFILAGTPGSLKYLRKYGFRTFHGLIDETYDSILDPVQRLTTIAQEMKRLSNLDENQKNLIFSQLKTIACENRERFFSMEFQQQVIDEFRQNFDSAMKIVKKSYAGTHCKKIKKFCDIYFPNQF